MSSSIVNNVEMTRLMGMLKASDPYAQPINSNTFNPLNDPAVVSVKKRETFDPLNDPSVVCVKKQHCKSPQDTIPSTFLEALYYIETCHPLPPPPASPLSKEFQPRIDFVIGTLNKIANKTFEDIAGEMASRLPTLSTADLPAASPSEASATASPARGTAMLNSIFKSVRVPEFKYRWQFWAERGQQQPPAKAASATAGAEEYANRPKPLGEQIISVKDFYQHFNNIPVESLKLRDSIHLFHLGVKPLWEDPRNAKGGAWYFRIGKEHAAQFWHEICLLAVGDVLQGAVETKRACKSILSPILFHHIVLTVTFSLQRRHLRGVLLGPLECGPDRNLEPRCRQ